jgi:hypothetical protein
VNKTTTRRLLRPVIGCLLLTACYADAKPPEVGDEPTLGETSEELQTEHPETIRLNANPQKVCFQADKDDWDNHRAEYQAAKPVLRAWIEGAYEGLPNVNIDFVGFGDCPNFNSFKDDDEDPATIEVVINADGGGAQAFSDLHGLHVGAKAAQAWVIHEVGHTLGFDHEHRRKDAPGSVGTWNEYTKDKYGNPVDLTCIDGIVWDVDPDTNKPFQPTCDPSNTRQDAAGVYITRYDVWSIMNATNYCNCRAELSVLDKLGLEISYPTDASRSSSRVHFDRSFVLGDGSLVSYEGARLQNDWFVRGALGAAFDSGGLYWQRFPFFGGTFDDGEGFEVVQSGLYRGLWNDFLQRGHVSDNIQIEIAPSKATAILMAVI